MNPSKAKYKTEKNIVVCPFVLFLLAIVFSFLLRYTDSDYPFGILKLFLSGHSS